jgi:hypothetical protein
MSRSGLRTALVAALGLASFWAVPAARAAEPKVEGAKAEEPATEQGKAAAVPKAGESAPSTAAFASERKDGAIGEAKAAAASPGSLERLLKSIKADGPLKLPEAAQAELVALVPAGRRGEECAEGHKLVADASGLKDRGDGALLLIELDTCKGSLVMAFAPGVPTRVSRLLDLAEGESLASAHALNLAGRKREDDLGVELLVQPHRLELHTFLRRESAFAFTEVGTVKEYGAQGDCSAGGEVAAGFGSFVKVDAKGRLQVLRVDASCGSGPWAARCELWAVEKNAIDKAGVCALPPKLDARSLRASAWK